MNIWDFQTRLTRRLLVWAAWSVLVSTLAVFSVDPFWRGVAIQFFIWGAIDAAIAVFGAHVSARKQRSIQESERVEIETEEVRWLSRLLWINTGLDVFYLLGGLWLMQIWGASDPLWRGHGWGILIQVTFLSRVSFEESWNTRKHIVKPTGSACMWCRQGQRAECLSCCCTAFQSFGTGGHNPQKGLVLTKRFIISPLKSVQNG